MFWGILSWICIFKQYLVIGEPAAAPSSFAYSAGLSAFLVHVCTQYLE